MTNHKKIKFILVRSATSCKPIRDFIKDQLEKIENEEIEEEPELTAICIGLDFSESTKGTENEESDFIDYYMK